MRKKEDVVSPTLSGNGDQQADPPVIIAEAVADQPQVTTRRHWFWDHTIQIIGYWFSLIVQPILVIAGIVLLVVLFGLAQQNLGIFSTADSNKVLESTSADSGTEYVCPMLCVPPSAAPGRCPVCGMELQARKSSGDSKDIFGLTIDPASRRLSNIQTTAALNLSVAPSVTALGKIEYDETSLATISAYVDGRLDELFVDFTGAEVKQGDPIALLYSPDLYSAQVELLESRKAMESSTSTRSRIIESNKRLYSSALRRLVEFGVPQAHIESILESNNANSRIKIFSPISGTVVERMVDKGKYVKTGMPILKIADLSKVWLMLELYPEDAGQLLIGQPVMVSLQSQSGRKFEGQVAFVDPMVNTKTQTVSVRVIIPNEAGLIRIGNYARATIELADGKSDGTIVSLPRDAVMMSGDESVAYVETEAGRFEFRKVVVGSMSGDRVSVVSGIKPGEQVVTSAAFMVDAAFNMSGKPSLIDPTRAVPKDEAKIAADQAQAIQIDRNLANLSAEDRKLARDQVICPVTEAKLGAPGMGTPIRVSVTGRDVMICCEGCRSGLLDHPEKYLTILDEFKSSNNGPPELELHDHDELKLPKIQRQDSAEGDRK